MNRQSILFFFLMLGIFSIPSMAQKKKTRIQPSTLYSEGETLYSPKFGFTAKVPQGWDGILPRESEVFLLSSTTSTYGEIFIFGNEKSDLNTLKNNWDKGVELSSSIRMKAINPTINNGILSGEITIVGESVNKENKGYAMARCSPSGPCVTMLMMAPSQFYESVKKTVTELMVSSKFEQPSDASPYADFDWQEFLSNKVLVTYASAQGGSKETMIHLCQDGNFTANIKKKGFFKEQNPAYKGKIKGQWKVNGEGEKATIHFTFSKKGLEPLEVPVMINDEKIVSNGERYFVGNSDECKM